MRKPGFILAILFLLLVFGAARPTAAATEIPGYVFIDYPTPNPQPIGGLVVVNGRLTRDMLTSFSLDRGTGAGGPWTTVVSACQVMPDYPYSTSYICNWNTTETPNGDYWIRVKGYYINVDSQTQYISSSIGVHIYNQPYQYTPPSPLPTPTPQNTTSSPTQQTTTKTLTKATPTPSPKPSAAATIVLPNQELLSGSTVVDTITFNLDLDKAIRMEKIEKRLSTKNTQFLVMSGKTNYPNALVTITIHSEPLVMTTTSDSNGNWSYTLENPLDPGQHEAYVEVVHNGKAEKSSTYTFAVAEAAAAEANPGSSLQTVNVPAQASKSYLQIVVSLIIFALLVLGAILYYKKTNKKNPSFRKAEPAEKTEDKKA